MIRVKEMIEYLKTFNEDTPIAIGMKVPNDYLVTGIQAHTCTVNDNFGKTCDVLVFSSDEIHIETSVKFLLRKKDNVNIQDN
jgi:hypothetical protein